MTTTNISSSPQLPAGTFSSHPLFGHDYSFTALHAYKQIDTAFYMSDRITPFTSLHFFPKLF